MRRPLIPAVLAAVVLIALGAGPAAAATLHGYVLGPAEVAGAHATVPLALARGGEVRVTVPARSGFRTRTTGRTHADALRLGDVVTARVRALVGGRARARYLRIDARSAAPTFKELDDRMGAAAAGARQALDEIGRIQAEEQSGGGRSPAQLRLYLLSVRYDLNVLIADLRSQAKGMRAVLGSVGSAPALQHRLEQHASDAGDAATKLEDGVTGLDEFINSIGELSPPLAPGGTDAVGQVLATVQQVLGTLGVPLPPLPAVPALP